MDLLRITAAVVLAAKVDRLVQKHPDFADPIRSLNEKDPTPQKKYLDYGVQALVDGVPEEEINDVVQSFHKNKDRLSQKDITRWKFSDLQAELAGLGKSNRETKKEIKVKGGEKIYEDDQCIVLVIRDHATACFYGSGTQWCITMDKGDHFKGYQSSGVVFFYVLRKGEPQSNPLYKVAGAFHRDGELNGQVEWFDAEDSVVTTEEALSGLSAASSILQKIESKAPGEDKTPLAKVKAGEMKFGDLPPEERTPDNIRNLIQDGFPVPADEIKKWWDADDKNPQFAMEIAVHDNAPPEVLKEIFDKYVKGDYDSDYAMVAGYAMRNPNTPVATAVAALAHPDAEVRYEIATREDLPPDVLSKLVDDKNKVVRSTVARNPSTPTEALERLLKDEDPHIAKAAKETLAGRSKTSSLDLLAVAVRVAASFA